MPRFSAGCKSGTPANANRPYMSLYAAAAVAPKVREVGAFNTTNTATDIKLARLTAAGTPGTALTEAEYDPDGAAASSTAANTHSADATLGDDLGYRASLGAAIGAGVIWTFGDSGIRVPVGTANGIGIVIADSATPQVLQCYMVWDE